MQENNSSAINIKFILLTEEISFIPDSILNCCEIVNISRPTRVAYTKCITEKMPIDMKVESITNIKNRSIMNGAEGFISYIKKTKY
jgi:hypothetical protein